VLLFPFYAPVSVASHVHFPPLFRLVRLLVFIFSPFMRLLVLLYTVLLALSQEI